MIVYLKGKIQSKKNGWIILNVHDIGYRIFLNSSLESLLEIGEESGLYIHQHLREDAANLYGFKTIDELDFFELLLSISGVGPKSALGVLSVARLAEIKHSIAHGDPVLLTKVSGIGRKTAERVILELREKISLLAESADEKFNGADLATGADEVDALVSLGYSASQAREALRAVDQKIINSSERIKEALRKLGK